MKKVSLYSLHEQIFYILHLITKAQIHHRGSMTSPMKPTTVTKLLSNIVSVSMISNLTQPMPWTSKIPTSSSKHTRAAPCVRRIIPISWWYKGSKRPFHSWSFWAVHMWTKQVLKPYWGVDSSSSTSRPFLSNKVVQLSSYNSSEINGSLDWAMGHEVNCEENPRVIWCGDIDDVDMD